MRALPWLLGGGAAIAAYVWTRQDDAAANGETEPGPSSSSPSTVSSSPPQGAAPLPGRWVWPVGTWRNRKPQISNGKAIQHGGVDLMFKRAPEDPYPTKGPNGSRGYVMPPDRFALAASDGRITYAKNTPRGWTVIIDHAPHKLGTYYTHMSRLLVGVDQPVRAGEPLGVIGADPLDAAHLMHLHFELWRAGVRIDPQPFMRGWAFVPGDPASTPGTLVARNAGARSAGARQPVRPHSRRWPRSGH